MHCLEDLELFQNSNLEFEVLLIIQYDIDYGMSTFLNLKLYETSIFYAMIFLRYHSMKMVTPTDLLEAESGPDDLGCRAKFLPRF